MKMYVANGTRQTQNFTYRLPGEPGLKSHFIPVGAQLLIPRDLDQQEVNYIIKYHAKYGFVAANDVDRTKPYIGLVYSIDRPVPPPRMQSAMHHNIEVLTERGRENRRLAAIAANQELEKSLANNPGLADLNNMEMTIVEETPKGFSVRRDAVREGFHVSRDVSREQDGRAGRGGRAEAASKGKGRSRAKNR